MCDVAAELQRLRNVVVGEVYDALKEVEIAAGYTTVWREFEDAANKEIIRVLKANTTLTDENFNTGEVGREKNRLADLAIVCNEGAIAISIKTARTKKNPQNDLGTFRAYASKKRQFSHTFELWIRYADSGDTICTDAVFFDEAYRFVGVYKATGGVAYRKKDGNLRPKPWRMFDDDTAFWNTHQEFARAFEASRIYRANSLVQEHLHDLADDDLRLLYETLKQKFEGQAAVSAAQPGTSLLLSDDQDK